MSRGFIRCLVGTVTLMATVDAQQFEVASIKVNQQDYIDLGAGVRLLSGRVRC